MQFPPHYEYYGTKPIVEGLFSLTERTMQATTRSCTNITAVLLFQIIAKPRSSEQGA